jgi:hypothetical protein
VIFWEMSDFFFVIIEYDAKLVLKLEKKETTPLMQQPNSCEEINCFINVLEVDSKRLG